MIDWPFITYMVTGLCLVFGIAYLLLAHNLRNGKIVLDLPPTSIKTKEELERLSIVKFKRRLPLIVKLFLLLILIDMIGAFILYMLKADESARQLGYMAVIMAAFAFLIYSLYQFIKEYLNYRYSGLLEPVKI